MSESGERAEAASGGAGRVLPYATAAEAPHPEGTLWQKIAWVMYDWANSGYGLIIIGPLFSFYFISTLLPPLPHDPSRRGLMLFGVEFGGDGLFGIMTSLSMALMALGAPVLGAVADIKGWTKPLLIIHATVGSALAMMMFHLEPGAWGWAIVLYVLSNYCFGASGAFYNAYLPKLTRPERQGSLSGWGFALGYVGGAVALILAGQMDVRVGLAFAGVWWLGFSLPAFFLLPQFPAQATEADRGPVLFAGFRRIRHTFRNIRQYRMLFLFLLAFLLYNDGVETVIAMSPAFGTAILKMSSDELVRMFLIVQFVAFGGAMGFGYLADRIGNKPVVAMNLAVWVLAGVLAYWVRTPGQFMALGIMIGLVLGGVQSSSRALMGLLAPRHIHNEAFGFFSISGKFASILGPLLYSGLATWGRNAYGPEGARLGIFSVLPFLVGGLVLLMMVKEPRRGTGEGRG